jgi:polyphosphate kinase
VFAAGGDTEVWLGSADMMHRNLDRRVEALVSITDPRQISELVDLFDLAMSEQTMCWVLGPDGDWERNLIDATGARLGDLQQTLIETRTSKRAPRAA